MHRATCLFEMSNHSPLNMSTGGPMFSWQLAHAALNRAQPAKISSATVGCDARDLLVMMVVVITSSGNITTGSFIRLSWGRVGLPFVCFLMEDMFEEFLFLKGCLGGLASAVCLPATNGALLCAESECP